MGTESPSHASVEMLAPGTQIGEFRVRGLLGEGAMGEVYLAQDTVLGRRVALKLIKRAVMAADGVARFLEEARATASFSHPNIVMLHAVGEHDGRPYLALEHVDGESLRARLRGGPLAVREALRCVRAIAEAIAEAHARGIVHADLKPENVLIPRDGRVRVVDFGLAKLMGGESGSTSGTPAYMAPERLRGVSPTGAIDVWAIGVMLAELVNGVRPIADGALVAHVYSKAPLELIGVPTSGWGAVVRTCLAVDPAERPSAEELVRRIGVQLDPRAAVAAAESERSPFPGLVAFSRDDAGDYFGRAAELDALVESLRVRPLVPIVGPSGIGKSSFVQAALLPRLEEGGRWHVVQLRPGAAPFSSLAAALAGAAAPELAADLRAHRDGLSLRLAALAVEHDARVLLFVDQFEETFTLAAADEAAAFADCVASAAGAGVGPTAVPSGVGAAMAGEPWRVVLTVRDDFLARLADSPRMREHLGAVAPLAPLGRADLLAAINGPLANAGYAAEPTDLPARIVDDVAGRPACLPLLQFACRALWERRDVDSHRVLGTEYDAMGGATGALASHAQALMSELAADQVRVVRALLLGLFHPDGTRRPRLRRELLDGLPPGAGDVVDQLLARRLIVATRDVDHDEASLEVAHEALATAWPQLARWLDETYEQRLLVIELEQATQLWQRRGQRDDETWSGAALGEAVRKCDEWNVTLPSQTRAFLDASQRRATRTRRRRRLLLGSAIAALLVVTVASIAIAIDFADKEAQAQLAAADMGEFDLELEPFDWDPTTQKPLLSPDEPHFSWGLYSESDTRVHEPGEQFSSTGLSRGRGVWQAGVLRTPVEARSGSAVLVISNRGSGCQDSWIFIKHLPGYRERRARGDRDRIRVTFPSCATSKSETILIPEGPFYASVQDGTRDEIQIIKEFSIDRHEVTRGEFLQFSNISSVTGDESVDNLTSPDTFHWPVTGVDFQTARDYCRFQGKDLPTRSQWQKAFRGGLKIANADNPSPIRHQPWVSTKSSEPARLRYDARPSSPANVEAYPDDRSPYGVFDLAGNISEWSTSVIEGTSGTGYRATLGGNWDSLFSDNHHDISWQNVRNQRYLDFVVGLRCINATEPSDFRFGDSGF